MSIVTLADGSAAGAASPVMLTVGLGVTLVVSGTGSDAPIAETSEDILRRLAELDRGPDDTVQASDTDPRAPWEREDDY